MIAEPYILVHSFDETVPGTIKWFSRDNVSEVGTGEYWKPYAVFEREWRDALIDFLGRFFCFNPKRREAVKELRRRFVWSGKDDEPLKPSDEVDDPSDRKECRSA